MTKNSEADFVFLPLGGSGEIGMNLNVFGYGPKHKRHYFIADIGVTFGDRRTPGVDVIMPEISFLEDNVDRVLGIVLTHAHEDHMGAVARLWPRLRCPIYATPFTAYLVRDRLAEADLLDEVEIIEVELGGKIALGPFDIELITLTHSIPEPNALAIRTELGTVLHTGDWKIDPNPRVGETVDETALKLLGEQGVLAMICDSTNVFSPGVAGSEEDVKQELSKLIGEYDGRKIAVASFASNVARTVSVIEAAQENGRAVCLVGRSMHRMWGAASHIGLTKHLPHLVDEEEASQIPDGHILYLCTGSQGEPRAALRRIAEGSHRNVSLSEGDVVVFSSKMIPGNEKDIFALQNALAELGVIIQTEKSRPIHVSGHPCRDELKAMYDWVKPQIAIPVHGERRHLLEHAELAKSLGVELAHAPHNGEMIRMAPHGPKIVDMVPNGRLYDDGGYIVPMNDEGIRKRIKMSYSGHVGVTLVVNRNGKILAGPEPRISGLPEGKDGEFIYPLLDDIADEAERVYKSLRANVRRDEELAEDAIRSKIKRLFRHRPGYKNPVIEVTILEV